jgi:ABC-type multidrug transport system fused ATPase/permease subunit
MTVAEAYNLPLTQVLERIELTPKFRRVWDYLKILNLDYLSLDRALNSLSGGEKQRIYLLSKLLKQVQNSLLIFENISFGLSERELKQLGMFLQDMVQLKNTVVVVEHDKETIHNADYLIELGPKAGKEGGYLVAKGTLPEIKKEGKSLTGAYLFGIKKIPITKRKLATEKGWIELHGATQFNLKNVDLVLPLGKLICVSGMSGSGKSTFASALMRLVEVPSGQIFIDGIDITKMRIENLREIISFVPQDSFLFSATMRDNIRYGKPQAFDHEVEDFANKARIEQEILKFPQQYDTFVGERGITLSGGQRQRTALARALLVDTPILVLDDSLSSVDNQTATGILNNLPQNKTVLFITHNLSAASTCDRLILMDAGKIAQVGTHAELLAESQLYQKLWNQHKLEAAIK